MQGYMNVWTHGWMYKYMNKYVHTYIYIYIYIYIYCGRKKTNKLQVHPYCLFPPTIYTSLYSYVLSTVLRESKFLHYIYMYMYKRLIKRLNKRFIYNIHGCIHRHIHTPPPLLSLTKKERFKSKRFIDDFFLVTYVFSFSTSNIY